MGWSHLLQAAVPIAALALAWWQPRIGGDTLLAIGIIASVWYAASAANQQWPTTLIVVGIAFVPIIISGALFLRASYVAGK